VVGVSYSPHLALLSFPTRRSSDLLAFACHQNQVLIAHQLAHGSDHLRRQPGGYCSQTSAVGLFQQQPVTQIADGEMTDRCEGDRSEEHTSELQSRENLVCRLLLEK